MLFMEKVGDEEWKMLYEQGKPFRLLSDRLHFQVGVWASDEMEAWVDERRAWAKDHPGVGFPEGDFDDDDEPDEPDEDDEDDDQVIKAGDTSNC